MKNLLMLIAVTFSFAIVNAQSSVEKSSSGQSVKAATKKSCSGAAKSGKSCSKTCGSSQAAYSKLVSPTDFKSYMNRFPAEQVVDVRTKKEIKANGMIDGAMNIDFNASYFKEEILKLDKNTAIMVYCRSGNRSGKAAKLLKDWGFKKIYDMDGGYNAYLETLSK